MSWDLSKKHGGIIGIYWDKHGISWDYFVNRNTENLGVNHI